MRKFILAILAAIFASTIIGVAPASAGGACGSGGLIRGTIGKWCDKHIEGPITTPVARGVTMWSAQAAGAVAAGYFGLPPQVGQVAGSCLGNNINSQFAGRGSYNCSALVEQGFWEAGMSYVPNGVHCATPDGVFGPGMPQPVGSQCYSLRTGAPGYVI